MALRRRCLGCGTLTEAGRCPTCRAAQRAKYQGDWREESKRTIEIHVQIHGQWCPGWKCEPHESQDLTTDHGPPRRVLCRACNARKKALGDG